ncbi:MAG: hypothetical protein ABIH34_07345 [Nanoarchaeota archaeon]
MGETFWATPDKIHKFKEVRADGNYFHDLFLFYQNLLTANPDLPYKNPIVPLLLTATRGIEAFLEKGLDEGIVQFRYEAPREFEFWDQLDPVVYTGSKIALKTRRRGKPVTVFKGEVRQLDHWDFPPEERYLSGHSDEWVLQLGLVNGARLTKEQVLITEGSSHHKFLEITETEDRGMIHPGFLLSGFVPALTYELGELGLDYLHNPATFRRHNVTFNLDGLTELYAQAKDSEHGVLASSYLFPIKEDIIDLGYNRLCLGYVAPFAIFSENGTPLTRGTFELLALNDLIALSKESARKKEDAIMKIPRNMQTFAHGLYHVREGFVNRLYRAIEKQGKL